MSTTINDVSTFGDVKGRDNYMRNLFHSVKGDGASASSITQGFYGIPSSTTTEAELGRITVSEGVSDDAIGTLKISLSDGSALVDSLSVTSSGATLVGEFNTGVVQKNDLALGAKIELVDDALEPAINFVLGDLAGTPLTSMVVTDDTVAVEGTLTVQGTDVLDLITNGNPWESTGAITQLKTEYTSVEINVVNPYTTALALDVNGSTRIRGNDIFFYDEPLTTFYSTLAYVETTGEVRLRASRAGDSVVIATTDGNDNTYLDRLTFTDGAATQNAIFNNVNVGIGATPSGTHALEVVGSASLSSSLTMGGNVDMVGNNLVNVTQLESSDVEAEQVRIVLTSDATSPQVDVIIGDLAGTPTTAMTLTETSAALNVPTTVNDNLIITGDLTVQGTTVTLNTSEVSVEDINIELASEATLHTEINGGGISLGTGVTGITTPALLYSEPNTRWEFTVPLDVTGDITTSTTTVNATGLDMRSDSAFIYMGANQQWRLGLSNDGTNDFFEISHDDAGLQTTWDTKLSIQQ